MTTVADLIQHTWSHLYTSHRRSIDLLSGALSDTTGTSVVLSEGTQVMAGAELEVDDELMYVRSFADASRTATVIRGWAGTTAATHADASLVEVNPRFPKHRVRRALQDEVRSWPSDLYATLSVNIDTSSDAAGYDLAGIPSTYLSIIDVQLGDATDWTNDAVVRPRYYEVRGADTTIYPSGSGIVLTSAVGAIRDLRVTVAVPFTTSSFADAVNVESTIGLASSMVDIPPIGAAARLMVGREVKRTFGEGQAEPRRAEEVPIGSNSGTSTYLRREAQRRIAEEIVRLRASYPIRRG